MTLGTLLSFAGPLLPVSKRELTLPFARLPGADELLQMSWKYVEQEQKVSMGSSGKELTLFRGLVAWRMSTWHRKKGVEPVNNVTRNTNSPQRGAETLRLVKTRLSSFCAASEKDLGRWPGLVSVGSAVRSWQSPDCYSSTECPNC